MKQITFYCMICLIISGCDGISKVSIDVNETFEIFSTNYGVYKPENITNEHITVYRFEWLEASDTYFMRFTITPEEFQKFEQSADIIGSKEPITEILNNEPKNKNQMYKEPKWYSAKITKGFKISYQFKKISENKDFGDTLNLHVKVDNSDESRLEIYINCNHLIHW